MTDIASYYPNRHLAPIPVEGGNSWQNDGQNYVYDEYEGLWRTWALGNPEWTPDAGFPMTSWISYSGETIDTMQPEGVFIDRNQSLGLSFWSGSCWVDNDNKLGRGYGSAYYFISGPDPDIQGIALLVAPRLGQVPYSLGMCCSPDIVPEKIRDGGRDFRDCRVFWDDKQSCLIMSTTIGPRFLFLKSTDATNWEAISVLEGPTSADGTRPLLECPNVVELDYYDRDGNSKGKKWVIIGACQQRYDGGTDSNECCSAWIGEWDGTEFIPDENAEAIPLDFGPDSYAAVAGEHGENKFFGYWIGNWNYSLLPSPYKGFQNVQSFPRNVWVQDDYNGNMRVFSYPVQSTNDYEVTATNPQIINSTTAFDASALQTSQYYRLDINFEQLNNAWPEEIKVLLKTGTVDGKDYHTDLIFKNDGTVTFDRTNAGDYPNSPNTAPDAWFKDYRIPASLMVNSGTTMTLTILVDTTTIEAFVNNGAATLTGLVFPPLSCNGIAITASDDVVVSAAIQDY